MLSHHQCIIRPGYLPLAATFVPLRDIQGHGTSELCPSVLEIFAAVTAITSRLGNQCSLTIHLLATSETLTLQPRNRTQWFIMHVQHAHQQKQNTQLTFYLQLKLVLHLRAVFLQISYKYCLTLKFTVTSNSKNISPQRLALHLRNYPRRSKWLKAAQNWSILCRGDIYRRRQGGGVLRGFHPQTASKTVNLRRLRVLEVVLWLKTTSLWFIYLRRVLSGSEEVHKYAGVKPRCCNQCRKQKLIHFRRAYGMSLYRLYLCSPRRTELNYPRYCMSVPWPCSFVSGRKRKRCIWMTGGGVRDHPVRGESLTGASTLWTTSHFRHESWLPLMFALLA